MNKEKQRIAIAEACDWVLKHCKYHNATTWHSPFGICAEGNAETVLPDYLNDLNAMHEAEKLIMDERSIIYLNHLNILSCPWHATAEQRAEALLRTIGKWEE